jgi:hypothetical protein
VTTLHVIILSTLAILSITLAFFAYTSPHPAHLAIAFMIAWALLEVCINIYHKEKNK